MKKRSLAGSIVSFMMMVFAVFLSLLVSCEDIMGVKLNIENRTSELFEVKLQQIGSDKIVIFSNIPAQKTVTQNIDPGNYRLWSRVYHPEPDPDEEETEWIGPRSRFYDDGIEKTEVISSSSGGIP